MKELLKRRVLGMKFETFVQCFVGTTMFMYFVVLPVSIDMKSQLRATSRDISSNTLDLPGTKNRLLLDTMEKRIAFRKYLLNLGAEDNKEKGDSTSSA
jgi:hypothetical protein